MATEKNLPSFARDIQPLFWEKDRASMKRRFDLWNYHDVSTYARPILEQLSSSRMPCDGK
jgi:hypothetical protein